MLRIVDVFAEEFDALPALLPDREDYRVLIAAGTLVRALTVVGQLSSDGAVELISLEIDLQFG